MITIACKLMLHDRGSLLLVHDAVGFGRLDEWQMGDNACVLEGSVISMSHSLVSAEACPHTGADTNRESIGGGRHASAKIVVTISCRSADNKQHAVPKIGCATGAIQVGWSIPQVKAAAA